MCVGLVGIKLQGEGPKVLDGLHYVRHCHMAFKNLHNWFSMFQVSFLDWLTIPLTPTPQHQSQITSSISLIQFQFKHSCTDNHQN
ncbi:hypothetical protein L1887_31523 [Cichorium endivia]|nr:hypothetical protein L1887_31523 [Cichorium endivia]